MRSKKEVDAMVSGWGLAGTFLTSFLEIGKERGLSSKEFHRLGRPEGRATIERFVDIMAENVSPEFKIRRTVKLGTPGLRAADDFRKAIKANGMKISDWANDILGKPAFDVTTEETEIDLVVASVAELGFNQGARRDQIYARAKELGLEPCPAEVGPQLRLQYGDQPLGDWLLVAMEPITDSDGRPLVFSVVHAANGLWLSCHCAFPEPFWRTGS